MKSTNIEKSSAVSEDGHVLAGSLCFFVAVGFVQYADQELLKSLF